MHVGARLKVNIHKNRTNLRQKYCLSIPIAPPDDALIKSTKRRNIAMKFEHALSVEFFQGETSPLRGRMPHLVSNV